MVLSAAGGPAARIPRSDALANRERVLDAAVRIFARDGMHVPVADIAREAGVGVATFYRSFPDRMCLLQELERRAYAALNGLLDRIEESGETGIPAIRAFLLGSLRLSDLLILPLHGAPPLVDAEAAASRASINERLRGFIDDARRAGAIVNDVNATDIVMCSALITQPLRHGPDWGRTSVRHVSLFVEGLGAGSGLPVPPVLPEEVERTFAAVDASSVKRSGANDGC